MPENSSTERLKEYFASRKRIPGVERIGLIARRHSSYVEIIKQEEISNEKAVKEFC